MEEEEGEGDPDDTCSSSADTSSVSKDSDLSSSLSGTDESSVGRLLMAVETEEFYALPNYMSGNEYMNTLVLFWRCLARYNCVSCH